MRVSVRKGDPGHHPQAVMCKVLLDGAELSECFTADEELGKAYCHVTDDDGRPALTDDKQSIKEETKTGKVEIIKPDNWKEI